MKRVIVGLLLVLFGSSAFAWDCATSTCYSSVQKHFFETKAAAQVACGAGCSGSATIGMSTWVGPNPGSGVNTVFTGTAGTYTYWRSPVRDTPWVSFIGLTGTSPCLYGMDEATGMCLPPPEPPCEPDPPSAPYPEMHWDVESCSWRYDQCTTEMPLLTLAGWYPANSFACTGGCGFTLSYGTAQGTSHFAPTGMSCVDQPPPDPLDPEECAEGEVLTRFGCQPDNGCPLGYVWDGAQCIPDSPEEPDCGVGFHYVAGIGCVSDDPPDIVCPAGTTKVGDTCVADEPPEIVCPSGSHRVGDACVLDDGPDPPPDFQCPPGSRLVGNSCLLDGPPDVQCPAGSVLVGDACIMPDPPEFVCPAGSHLVGGQCVGDDPPDPGCPAGSTLIGGVCQLDAPPELVCPEGSQRVGEQCIGEPPELVCPVGSVLVGARCVVDPPPELVCPEGSTLVGEQCVGEPPELVCPSGFSLVGADCVSDVPPGPSCPAGQVVSGSSCVSATGPSPGRVSGPDVGLTEFDGSGLLADAPSWAEVWAAWETGVEGSPLGAALTELDFSIPVGSCPVFSGTIPWLNTTLTFDAHCDLWDSISGIISVISLLAYTFIAFKMFIR